MMHVKGVQNSAGGKIKTRNLAAPTLGYSFLGENVFNG